MWVDCRVPCGVCFINRALVHGEREAKTEGTIGGGGARRRGSRGSSVASRD